MLIFDDYHALIVRDVKIDGELTKTIGFAKIEGEVVESYIGISSGGRACYQRGYETSYFHEKDPETYMITNEILSLAALHRCHGVIPKRFHDVLGMCKSTLIKKRRKNLNS